ncbi:MAG: alpha/beta hydrolase [Idiomarina sp.]|nr:alpha/beta hydrolase [Idiomarina sp.]
MQSTSFLIVLSVWLSVSFSVTANVTQSPTSTPVIHQVEFSQVSALTSREPDQVIRYGDQAPQFIEFWQARGATSPAPLIVMVHGGCWLNAFGVDHTRAAATTLSEQGFAVGSVEYRRLGDEGAGWPNSRDDIIEAIDRLTSMPLPSINIDQVVVVGHSAGGHLALHAAEHTQVRPVLTIGLAAITDLLTYSAGEGSCQQAATSFLDTAASGLHEQLNVQLHSPLQRVLFSAQADTIVDPLQAELGTTKAMTVAQAGHFDFIHPDTMAWNLWLQYIKDALGE